MSLLVLDPDIAGQESLGNQLLKQLTELDFHTIDTTDARATTDLALQGSVELVACCCACSTDLPDIPATIPRVWVVGETPSADDLLTALRGDVCDVWQLPIDSDELSQRVADIRQRMNERSNVMQAEMSEMRLELERDQRAGQYIQMGMLPPNPMDIGHYRLQHKLKPSLLLSGDFVDYFQISDRYFACYVADVAGHGASSAFVTVLLKNFSRRLRREYRVSMLSNPGEVLAWINTELIDQGLDKHVAMFFGIFDTQSELLHYANAAHLPPASLVLDGKVTSLEQRAKPLGLFPDLAYQSLTVEFPKGAKLVVFSDGVFDLIDQPTLAEKEALLADAIIATDNMDELWSNFKQDLQIPDDVSCLMVQYA